MLRTIINYSVKLASFVLVLVVIILPIFHYLARQTQSAPLILLATCRSEATTTVISPFGSLLNALYRERLSQVITLAPLPESAVAQIMNHVLGGEAAPALIKAVAAVTEGNPFFVQEITRAVLTGAGKTHALDLQNGQWRLQPGAGLRVPSGLQEVLRERVQRLGPAVESALTAAAVVGREFQFAVLQGMANLPDHELLDALDVALAGHLLEETQDGYRFRHPLIRHTLYDALSRTRRTRLHTRAAEATEGPLDEIASLMRHMASGQTLEVRATDPSVAGDLPAWCRLSGHEFIKQEGDRYLIRHK